MPSKRAILNQLDRQELQSIADRFELMVDDRRVKDKLVDAVASSKRATLASVLADLSRERLKDLCRLLDVDDGGREKSVLIDRLSGSAGPAVSSHKEENGVPKSASSPERPAKKNGTASKKNGGDLGFEATLWQAADKLRNNMDAAEYKHVVLGLIFLKYISDAFQERYRELEREIEDGADPEDPDEYRAKNIFWVPQDARWEKIQANAKKSSNGQVIDDAMTAIERENRSLKSVLPKNYSRPQLDKHRLGELIDLIATIGLGDAENRSKDILGRVYEYFLSEFAAAEGKNAGQFYTPRSVVRVLVEMLAPYKGRVFDPCCGSGGMFVQSERFIEEHGGRLGDISIYGQESNPTTWRLAKMNLAIRGIDADLGAENADSFHHDLHRDLKADFILANPPFNDSDWGGERLREDLRWKHGAPPVSSANFAWVQHFIHHLSPKGVAGFVLANGSMSSNQSGEGEIRKAIIEGDLVDCMVSLPGQLFYSTPIKVCLWFLARDKGGGRFRNRRGETLFVDARKMGSMIDRTHRQLTDEDVSQIANTYHAWRGDPAARAYENVPGFCFAAKHGDLEKHGFVLTPSRYVGSEEEEQDAEAFEERTRRLLDALTTQLDAADRLSQTLRSLIPRIAGTQ